MVAKYLVVFVAVFCLVQFTSAQCIGNGYLADDIALAGGAFGYPGLAYGATPCNAYGSIAPTSGGGFPITSTSAISPTGITVISENAIEGPLSVIGELPFLGAVAFEGDLVSTGIGGINYGCGNGAVGIVSEGVSPISSYGPGIAPAPAPGRFGPAGPGYGYNGIPAGCGYGAYY